MEYRAPILSLGVLLLVCYARFRDSRRALPECVATLLMCSGAELLAAAAGIRVGESVAHTPCAILFSFGTVMSSMGVGVTTGVMGSAFFYHECCMHSFLA